METTTSKNINFQTSREVWPVETTTFKNLFFQASGEALPVEKTTSKNIMAGNSSSTPRLSISPSAKNKMILISQTKSRKLNKLQEWPQDFINIVTSLNEMRYPAPHHSQFKFEMSALAAEHNWKILSQYENLGEAIEADNSSPLQYGSEFKHTSDLSPLLCHHPLWPRLKSILERGVVFPLTPITEQERSEDLKAAITFGNHKGASEHSSLLKSWSLRISNMAIH